MKTINDRIAELIVARMPAPPEQEVLDLLQMPADGLVEAEWVARLMAATIMETITTKEVHSAVVHDVKLNDGIAVGDQL